MAPTEGPPPHPFLLRIATRILQRADRSQGARPARLRLDVNEAPELHARTDFDGAQRHELLLRDLVATGWVTLLLDPPREFAGFADRNPRIELREFEAMARWVGFERRSEQWQSRFRDAVAQHQHFAGDARTTDLLAYLARNPLSSVEGLSIDEAISSLARLRALCESGTAMPLREASAQVFQGRSKVLDNREELLRLLGASAVQFWEAPTQMLIDVPTVFDEALFVENLMTFERMADTRRPAWERALLVYAAGFKGSAQRLRSRSGCRIYLREPGDAAKGDAGEAARALEAVKSWLFDRAPLPVQFFGDLDYSGMQILASLREVFPVATAWRPGYEVLAQQLAEGAGHAPGMAAKEQQVDPGSVGCPYADGTLLPSMRFEGRFIDQEVFDVRG